MTRKSPVGAFQAFGKAGWLSAGGWINAIIPVLIVPYYSVIGGWVIKYLIEYIRGNGKNAGGRRIFSEFISDEYPRNSVLSCSVCSLDDHFTQGCETESNVSKFMMPY